MKDSIYFAQLESNLKTEWERFLAFKASSDDYSDMSGQPKDPRWIRESKSVALQYSRLNPNLKPFRKSFDSLEYLVEHVFSEPFLEILAQDGPFSVGGISVVPDSHADSVSFAIGLFLFDEQKELLYKIVEEMQEVRKARNAIAS